MASNTRRKNARTLYLGSTVEKILSNNWIFSKNDTETFLEKDFITLLVKIRNNASRIDKVIETNNRK